MDSKYLAFLFRLAACALLTVLLVPAVLSAQINEVVTVDLVEVYLSAMDSDSRPIEDLTAATFTVEDEGKRKEITHFTRLLAKDSDVPLTILYLMDTSGSMAQGSKNLKRLDVAKNFARMALAELKPGDQMQLSAFDLEYRALTPLTSEPAVIERALDSMRVEGNPGTFMLKALQAAAEDLKQRPGRKILVLCSDGETEKKDRKLADAVIETLLSYDITVLALGTTIIEEWGGWMGQNSHPAFGPGTLFGLAFRALTAPPRGGRATTVFAQTNQGLPGSPPVAVGSYSGDHTRNSGLSMNATYGSHDEAMALLKKIAEKTGGFAFFPQSEKKLDTAIDQLRLIMRAQYMIGFSPDQQHQGAAVGKNKKQWRKIKVECSRKGVKLRYRKAYFSG